MTALAVGTVNCAHAWRLRDFVHRSTVEIERSK
jgi:hypothetical protein